MNMISHSPDKADQNSKPPVHPPDKGGRGVGGQGGFIPYDKALTDKTRENRKNPTPAEKRLWFEVLQNKRLGEFKFIRQKPIDHYI